MESFKTLAAMDCGKHVEKKGKFSYLSWPWAVSMLRETDPKATWEVKRFDGVPYLKTDCGYFVEVAVTVEGVTLSQIHPILNAQNRPVEKPNAFDVNTSIQRCLVKAIALHGLGLYIYAGEDLPPTPTETTTEEEPPAPEDREPLPPAATLETIKAPEALPAQEHFEAIKAATTVDELVAAWKATPKEYIKDLRMLKDLKKSVLGLTV